MKFSSIVLLMSLLVSGTFAVTDDLRKEWLNDTDYLFKNNTCESSLCIEGRVIEIIDQVFKDYIMSEHENISSIKNYNFFVDEEQNTLTVGIDLDRNDIDQEFTAKFLGGGTKYKIDKKSLEIINRTFYEQYSCQSTLCVEGDKFKFINIAFSDYKKREKESRRKIKYYNFFIDEKEDILVVGIDYNRKYIYQKFQAIIFGGGGEYEIDKKTLEIVQKIFYK